MTSGTVSVANVARGSLYTLLVGPAVKHISLSKTGRLSGTMLG